MNVCLSLWHHRCHCCRWLTSRRMITRGVKMIGLLTKKKRGKTEWRRGVMVLVEMRKGRRKGTMTRTRVICKPLRLAYMHLLPILLASLLLLVLNVVIHIIITKMLMTTNKHSIAKDLPLNPNPHPNPNHPPPPRFLPLRCPPWADILYIYPLLSSELEYHKLWQLCWRRCRYCHPEGIAIHHLVMYYILYTYLLPSFHAFIYVCVFVLSFKSFILAPPSPLPLVI